MVESHSLLVRPSGSSVLAGGAFGVRVAEVCDGETGLTLGGTYRRRAHAAWLRWLMPPVLAVHEDGDEPLLFTVRCPWPLARRREVCDADNNLLGVLGPTNRLIDKDGLTASWIGGRHGHLVGIFQPGQAEDASGRFLDPDGVQLARVDRQDGGWRLTYGDQTADNPILRMLLLAAVIRGVSGLDR